MNETARKRLLDVLGAVNEILDYTGEVDLGEFAADRMSICTHQQLGGSEWSRARDLNDDVAP